MSNSIRIRTTPNSGENYVKVKLEQDFDFLEILSLKIRQEDAYSSYCSNYGVVAGRVSVNNGFGIPNVRVSIFIPISDSDKENDLIRELYPYESTVDNNSQGVRYNLLPKNKQHTDHTPVGTFPAKREVLDDETYIEVYDKYYRYSTRTNNSGDFMLFGVPVGEQKLFYDLDISDIGFLSARPFELIAQGFEEADFQDKFTFKSSNNLDDLVQLKSSAIPIIVKPFWCDTLNLGQEIGITMQDIPIEDYTLTPTAIFTGGVFSDDEKDSLNKNCRPRKKMGNMNEMITGGGNIEIIRRTQRGNIEFYKDLGDELIDENGNWSFQVPMNLRKVITSEDGTLIPSPDGVRGVATEADVRFRMSMNTSGDDKRLRTRAKVLVPNMLDNYEFDEFSAKELIDAQNNADTTLTGTTIFNINQDLSLTPPQLNDDPSNEYNYLENFATFRWKKVYTIRQYIGRFQSTEADENRNFIGFKDISDGLGVNKIPFNRIDTNINPLYTILCFLLTNVGLIVSQINGIINIINSLVTLLCQIRVPCNIGLCIKKCVKDDDEELVCPSDCNPTLGPFVNITIASINICYCAAITISWVCLVSPLLCGSCTNDDEYTDGVCESEYDCEPSEETLSGIPDECEENDNCCQDCCNKIPLIPLSCPDSDGDGESDSGDGPWEPVGIPTPFAPYSCNRQLIRPCLTCGGATFSPINKWVRCRLNKIAAALGVIKFDFYNDWVNGSLYFPLIKRKYKTKNRRKKIGQLKKDKFCDFNCYEPKQPDTITTEEDDYPILTNPPFPVGVPIPNFPPIELQGGVGKYLNTPIQPNYRELPLVVWQVYTPFLADGVNNRLFNSIHGIPQYEEIDGEDLGFTQYRNIGGHGHHQNICNSNRLIERKEFLKVESDCADDIVGVNDIIDGIYSGFTNNCGDNELPNQCTNGCTGGVKASNGICSTTANDINSYNKNEIKHGIIKWYKGNIYYASIIPNTSDYHNSDKIKGNLMYPTAITELGSSSFCDIDDQPFIIDRLEPTTYRISEDETGDGAINLSSYADIGCNSVNCLSTINTVISSQLGIEIYDYTDQGSPLGGLCETMFDHDDETREYFCRRFTTYIDHDLNINTMSPYSKQYENTYETYPEIPNGDDRISGLGDGNNGNGTINDGDGFFDGDKCKMLSNSRYSYAFKTANSGFDLTNYPDSTSSIDDDNGGVSFISNHTPYYFYFGLVPGKTALHKTVSKFFADKIDEVSLENVDGTTPKDPNDPNETPPPSLNDPITASCLAKI